MVKPVSDERNIAYRFNLLNEEITILRRQVADLQKRLAALENDDGLRQARRDVIYTRTLREDE